MPWHVEMETILRYLIDDTTNPKVYGGSRLEMTIVIASQLAVTEIDFAQDYTIDIAGRTITPDPTDAPRDNAFINLVCLKAACLLQTSFTRDAASNSITIKDGGSSISLGDRFDAIRKTALDYCEMYKKAKWDYEVGNSQLIGEVILGPLSSDEYTRG